MVYPSGAEIGTGVSDTNDGRYYAQNRDRYGLLSGQPKGKRYCVRDLSRAKQTTGLAIRNLALDAGYDVGAVHRGLELLGIPGYVSRREFHNAAMCKGALLIYRKAIVLYV